MFEQYAAMWPHVIWLNKRCIKHLLDVDNEIMDCQFESPHRVQWNQDADMVDWARTETHTRFRLETSNP